MKRYIILCITLLTIMLPVVADSFSLNTEVSSVSMGPNDFGFGLAPLGTNFVYYDSFQLSKKLQYNTGFSTRLIFAAPNNLNYSGYNYKTGTPKWINRYVDIKNIYDYWLYGYYFNPEASVNISLSQGFFTNPVAKSGPLLNLSIYWNTQFSMALEPIDTNKGNWNPMFIDAATGKHREPFGPGSTIPAYPWLQDTRETLVNYIGLSASLSFLKSRGFGVSDGAYLSASFEYGPKWLGNQISMDKPTSDFYYFTSYVAQYLTLYTKQQDNGLNWLSIQLHHANILSHTGGNIVPYHKLPSDRLENMFYDSLTLEIFGPQFIARDCYTDITLGFYNYCLFGNVVNEASRDTFASEWWSNLGLTFHMRLFGFMHFSYNISYSLYSGIHASNPGLWHNAKINFYISL